METVGARVEGHGAQATRAGRGPHQGGGQSQANAQAAGVANMPERSPEFTVRESPLLCRIPPAR
jgi:hypothetical protein